MDSHSYPAIKYAGPTVFLAFCLLLSPTFAQKPVTGFYIIMKTKKDCQKKLYSKNGEIAYCLTKEPIIKNDEFENIGDVHYDSSLKSKYLLLRLTEGGFQTLKILNQKLPGTRLALVVSDTVAGVFDSPNKILSRNIPVQGGINASEVEWIHDKLKQSVARD